MSGNRHQQQQQDPNASSTPSPLRLHLDEWDRGVFASELIQQSLFPRQVSSGRDGSASRLITPPNFPRPLSEGTFHGSKKAATEMFHRIEQRFTSFFDVANFESTVPQDISFEEKKRLYTYQEPGSDRYPPHLNLIPPEDKTGLLHIFDGMRLLDTGTLLGSVIPERILDFIHSDPDRDSIAGIEARNKTLRSEKKDIFSEPNIGDRPDWYTDAVFGQQQFTGTNPTTITVATAGWVGQFKTAAKAQQNEKMLKLLSSADAQSLYIQDCSYFRAAIGVAPGATMKSDDGERFGCAAVTLFQLNDEGKLHPLAIVIDYKETMDNSVVIFNTRLHASDSTSSEATDWPWRYAKLCAQISDWTRHEVTIHLTNTHFIEEAVIVAAHRAFRTDHPVYQLLQPHWLKTLSLNASARSALVPQVIVKLVGYTEDQLYAFVNDAYQRFNWTALYIPHDLETRGFPVDKLTSKKFHNYAYGKNISLLWQVLRTFVSSVLATGFTSDDQVARDPSIASWVAEMRSASGASIKSFPEIKTINELVDAVVMCIHIASPQHTAVNYLQEYYQSFVINKPPALCAPPPTSLQTLRAYKESDVMKALPVNRPREWLLASHLPHLLSYKVAEDQNLLNYAVSLAKLSALKGDSAVASAATTLYTQLVECIEIFKQNSKDMDDNTIPYDVLDPVATAISILI